MKCELCGQDLVQRIDRGNMVKWICVNPDCERDKDFIPDLPHTHGRPVSAEATGTAQKDYSVQKGGGPEKKVKVASEGVSQTAISDATLRGSKPPAPKKGPKKEWKWVPGKGWTKVKITENK